MLTSAKEGLCQTCRHGSGCALDNGSERVRQECEEFEVLGSGVPQAAVAVRPAGAAAKAKSKAEVELLGLCQNCRVRSSCRLPRPEGGIWFCEEYEVE
jgi:hypothetical protein